MAVRTHSVMPGTETSGLPIIQQTRSPYATLAYAVDPAGGVSALTGYPSAYPHVLNVGPVPDFRAQYAGIPAPYAAYNAELMNLVMGGLRRRGGGSGGAGGGQAQSRQTQTVARPPLAQSHVSGQVAPPLAISHERTQSMPPLASTHATGYQMPLIQPPVDVVPPMASSHNNPVDIPAMTDMGYAPRMEVAGPPMPVPPGPVYETTDMGYDPRVGAAPVGSMVTPYDSFLQWIASLQQQPAMAMTQEGYTPAPVMPAQMPQMMMQPGMSAPVEGVYPGLLGALRQLPQQQLMAPPPRMIPSAVR